MIEHGEMEKLRVAVACGGTGGHIFPGLATAGVLRERGVDVLVMLAGKHVERLAVAEWSGAWVTIPARGMTGHSPFGMAVAAASLAQAVLRCRHILRDFAPHAVLAMGSYAAVGPVLAARWLKVPVVLHEANAVPGRAVRWLARYANTVAVNFTETRALLCHPSIVHTGMPVRRFAASGDDLSALQQLAPDIFTLLVMGGSGGAHRLNELVCAAVALLGRKHCPLQVIHLAGAADADTVRRAYQQIGLPHAVYAFLHDMPAAFQRAHLAICRAGAATCVELTHFGVPALLVPYPFAVADHQAANAAVLQRAGAADLRREAELTPENLACYIEEAMRTPERLKKMRCAAQAMAISDGAERLADLVAAVACAVPPFAFAQSRC